ncbi:MAG: hypothetical protein U0903_06710 [Planctomycetales bacterium]
MEARILPLLLLTLTLHTTALESLAATFTTRNFVVHARTPEIAQKVAERAEQCRVEIAHWWLGYELKPWYRPCQVHVKDGQMGSGGATTFAFDRGTVGDWNMNVQGSEERILDSVIPHEVSHTIFACYFVRPLPRWADEGAATVIEHPVERDRQKTLTKQIIGTSQRIPLRELLEIKEYPQDMQKVLNLYAEGYTLCEWLVFHHGQQKYLSFLDAANQEGWDRAIQSHYGFSNIEALEQEWHRWIHAGFPKPATPPESKQDDQILVQNKKQPRKPETTVALAEDKPTEGEVRGQAPDVGTVRSRPANDVVKTRVAASPPPARRRSLEAPSPRSTVRAATTGDVALGEPGDINRAVAALNPSGSRRSTSEGWENDKPRSAPQTATRSSSRGQSPDEESEDEEPVEEVEERPQTGSRSGRSSTTRAAATTATRTRTVSDSEEPEQNVLRPAAGAVRARFKNTSTREREIQREIPRAHTRPATRAADLEEQEEQIEEPRSYRRARVNNWEAPSKRIPRNPDDETQ